LLSYKSRHVFAKARLNAQQAASGDLFGFSDLRFEGIKSHSPEKSISACMEKTSALAGAKRKT